MCLNDHVPIEGKRVYALNLQVSLDRPAEQSTSVKIRVQVSSGIAENTLWGTVSA